MPSEPLVDLYQTRIFYTVSSLQHQINYWSIAEDFSKAPGLPVADYEVVQKDASTTAWTVARAALLGFARVLWPAATNFYSAELWRYEANSLNGTFLTAESIDVDGSNAGAGVLTSEAIFTSRTAGGNILKFYAEEGQFPAGVPTAWIADSGGGSVDQFGAYWIGDDSPVVDRYGTFPIATLRQNQGINNKTERRRYRP